MVGCTSPAAAYSTLTHIPHRGPTPPDPGETGSSAGRAQRRCTAAARRAGDDCRRRGGSRRALWLSRRAPAPLSDTRSCVQRAMRRTDSCCSGRRPRSASGRRSARPSPPRAPRSSSTRTKRIWPWRSSGARSTSSGARLTSRYVTEDGWARPRVRSLRRGAGTAGAGKQARDMAALRQDRASRLTESLQRVSEVAALRDEARQLREQLSQLTVSRAGPKKGRA